MSDFISREAAIEEIDKWLDTVGTVLVGKGLSAYGELIGCIEDTPAADVAPVVRCRDCKYGELYSRNDGRTGVYCKCQISTFTYANDHTFTPVRNEDDFCSYGVRE